MFLGFRVPNAKVLLVFLEFVQRGLRCFCVVDANSFCGCCSVLREMMMMGIAEEVCGG